MTWIELVSQLRDRRVTLESDGAVRFMWLVPGVPAQSQEIRIELGEVGRDPWVVMSAPVFGKARLELERALRRSADMAIGAIVLVGDTYFVRFAVPLTTLVWSDFERALQIIAAEAVRMRQVSPDPRAWSFATQCA